MENQTERYTDLDDELTHGDAVDADAARHGDTTALSAAFVELRAADEGSSTARQCLNVRSRLERYKARTRAVRLQVLRRAYGRGDLSACVAAVESTGIVDEPLPGGVPLLVHAVQNGDRDAVERLLRAGVPPGGYTRACAPALFHAIDGLHLSAIAAILAHDRGQADALFPFGMLASGRVLSVSPLMYACGRGFDLAVHALMGGHTHGVREGRGGSEDKQYHGTTWGVDVAARNDLGWSALTFACFGTHTHVVRLLMRDARVRRARGVPDVYGMTPAAWVRAGMACRESSVPASAPSPGRVCVCAEVQADDEDDAEVRARAIAAMTQGGVEMPQLRNVKEWGIGTRMPSVVAVRAHAYTHTRTHTRTALPRITGVRTQEEDDTRADELCARCSRPAVCRCFTCMQFQCQSCVVCVHSRTHTLPQPHTIAPIHFGSPEASQTKAKIGRASVLSRHASTTSWSEPSPRRPRPLLDIAQTVITSHAHGQATVLRSAAQELLRALDADGGHDTEAGALPSARLSQQPFLSFSVADKETEPVSVMQSSIVDEPTAARRSSVADIHRLVSVTASAGVAASALRMRRASQAAADTLQYEDSVKYAAVDAMGAAAKAAEHRAVRRRASLEAPGVAHADIDRQARRASRVPAAAALLPESTHAIMSNVFARRRSTLGYAKPAVSISEHRLALLKEQLHVGDEAGARTTAEQLLAEVDPDADVALFVQVVDVVWDQWQGSDWRERVFNRVASAARTVCTPAAGLAVTCLKALLQQRLHQRPSTSHSTMHSFGSVNASAKSDDIKEQVEAATATLQSLDHQRDTQAWNVARDVLQRLQDAVGHSSSDIQEANTAPERAALRRRAAIRIQTVWRGWAARRRVQAMLNATWAPKLEEASGLLYFVHLPSGRSEWTLPKLARSITRKLWCPFCGSALARWFNRVTRIAGCGTCVNAADRASAADAWLAVTATDKACDGCDVDLALSECAPCARALCDACWAAAHAELGDTRQHAPLFTRLGAAVHE